MTKTITSCLAICLFLSACSLASVTPTDTPVQAVTFTPIATFTPTLSSPTTTPALFSPAPMENVQYDFTDHMCDAEWANSASYLPNCPGDLSDLSAGYVNALDLVFAESTTAIEASALVVLPAQNGVSTAIFGMYPAFEVWPGDRFRAALACQGDSACNVEFALEYFDNNGNYIADIPGWEWSYQVGAGPLQVDVNLGALAGQKVRFVLAVRDKDSDPTQDYALWINPYIYRDPAATPAPTSQIPGVISGRVDMSSAPPYLNDPIMGSSPVAVVFFNLDDGSYWWIHTTLTGHPNFQMTVSPGRYLVVAYARGTGGAEYVTAGYTGLNPSCGQALQTVNVPPNARVVNIEIADWNWTCAGTADRPDKPAAVPLP